MIANVKNPIMGWSHRSSGGCLVVEAEKEHSFRRTKNQAGEMLDQWFSNISVYLICSGVGCF